MTLEGVERLIITTFVDNFNIFAFVESGIIKWIKEKLAVAFDMADMKPLEFYVDLKVTYDYK